MVKFSPGLFACLLSCCLAVAPSWAAVNVGPPSAGGHPVGEPVGIQRIGISREQLTIDLRPLAQGEFVPVEAIYYLDNRGAEQTLKLLFAGGSQGLRDFQVWLDDQPIESRPDREAEIPESWQPPRQTPGLDGERPLDFRFYGYQSDQVVPIGFALTVPPGAHTLTIRYLAEPTRNFLGYPTNCWQFAYVLAPARSWDGFGGLEVTIELPKAWRANWTTDLIREQDRLLGQFDTIPADAIALTVQAPTGMWYPILLVASLMLFGITLPCGIMICWWRGRAVGDRLKQRAVARPEAVWPLAWPSAIVPALIWSGAVLLTGMVAFWLPVYSLPAHQVKQYVFYSPLLIFGFGLLVIGTFIVGFMIVYMTTTYRRIPPQPPVN
ncbi:MAG: hypothetical protein MK108_16685 [Mariniblastus sp.]|nr:hypothetical protein [Mariniblastus sp.]